MRSTNICWLLVPITFWVNLSSSWASSAPQFQLGDKLSVFSDKAYRKNQGRYFEAVGNVVIISNKDTLYGEVASLNQDSMMIKVEGNVRLVTKDLTLFGSHLDYNISTGKAQIKNARILTTDYNLVATEIVRLNPSEYIAREAEFSTCKDCVESWSVYGNFIRMKVGDYVEVKHGLFRIKGIDVIYVPYIIFPILSDRETGILFPVIANRSGEGLAFEQPFFWAIDESKDATLTPTFWAKRGYGGEVEYRQRFSELSWLQLNTILVNDQIYLPGKNSNKVSEKNFFRYFTEFESHQQWSSNLSSHIRYSSTRDIDIITDFPQYTDPKTLGSDFGLQSFLSWRGDLFSLSTDANYRRNFLFEDPLEFDQSYVQVLPRVNFSSTPLSLIQSEVPFFEHLALGADVSFTRFRQVNEEDSLYLRNADRLSVSPYLMWHFFTLGPLSFKSYYELDQQTYDFANSSEPAAGKNAARLRSEITFMMDKVFGLAYQEKIPLEDISQEDVKRLRLSKKKSQESPRKTQDSNRLIGEIPPFESEFSKDFVTQTRNSYRHSQEFKFIHHYLASENEWGNSRFFNQIESQAGQFDWEDAIRSREFEVGANTTRIIIPPQNTFEFQWSNTLIKKSPKNFSFLEDNKYLRDNFSYSRIAWFNLSQGYLLNNEDQNSNLRERLTRLMIDAGYVGNRWQIGVQEYYFHDQNENIFSLNFTKRFDLVNLFSNYSYNSFDSSSLNSISFGTQFRPTDTLGLAILQDRDLEANQVIRTVYSIDLMPNNNCWIFSLNYRESIVDSRYSFNLLFNFGDETFERFRTDYFAVRRPL